MENTFNISVVIVCYNEHKTIGRCLDSILAQSFEAASFEVIVVDNVSNDGTREIVESFCEKHPQLRLLVNPVRSIAKSRNIGWLAAKYDYVAYIDADCLAPEGWLQTLAEGLCQHRQRDPDVVAVGGANLPPRDTSSFYDALGIVLNTFLGNHGSAQGKLFEQDTVVGHLPTANILYSRKALLEQGGFDEAFGNVCEDPDLNHRLTKAGYKLVFLTKSYVWHYMRADLPKWTKNMFTYGKGRTWLIRKHKGLRHPMYLLPPLLAVSLLLALLGTFSPIFLLPLLYFPVILAVSVSESGKAGRWDLTFLVLAIYVCTQLAYGFGEIYGLFNKGFRKLSV